MKDPTVDKIPDSSKSLNDYAKQKGVVARVIRSLDGQTYGLFVPPGVCELEGSVEEIAVHIDLLAADLQFPKPADLEKTS